MTKGFEKNQARLNTLSLFGKDLARRSKSKCELSGNSNVALSIYEIPPVSTEPDFTYCLFLSKEIIQQLENPKKYLKPNEWHTLRELIWSDLPAIQIITWRILEYLKPTHQWAQDILDEAYLDDSIIKKALACTLGETK